MPDVALPETGSVVRVRQRTWLVEDVARGRTESEAVRVALSCLDDDAPGERLDVLWEHEVDAMRVRDAATLGDGSRPLDPPRMFAAWLHAVRWGCVTSTDAKLLQAPFRAGIDLKVYQLEPLRKALELPRVNLFIADDVGLGKTIEAGLVLQELVLRQRVDRVVIVAPPAVTRQWQEEMDQRFGLAFEVYDSAYVAARRRERGWGINPWTTHSRFIVSYALLRGSRQQAGSGPRTNHLELLLSSLGERAERSLLILDECHAAAPAAGQLYPVDTRTTRAIGELARRFEHRLFLSATPHNGHSHSFSALLEMLDPQRFTRGVKIASAAELAPVMVRRLKRHLRNEVEGLPRRVLVDHVVDAGADAPEVRIGALLARYDDLYRASLADLSKREQAARALVCVNLHKRLLSSVAAFHRTIEVHARSLSATRAGPPPPAPERAPDDDRTDAELDRRDDDWIEAATVDPGAAARSVLAELQTLARRHRSEPDARAVALAAWIRANLCANGRWTDRRVIVFTEYDDTLQWLNRVLLDLLDPLDTEGRIERYHGGLGESRREALKAAFNTSPSAHPLRVLLATDAAREGINLQAHCADLFHFDLPWNPGRIEQRNGRIDRVLQPEPEVRCHYFVVAGRPEDRVLAYLVRKLEVIREELGSLSEVISAELASKLQGGVRAISTADIDAWSRPGDAAEQARKELEGEGAESLRGDLEALRKQLDRSQRHLAWRKEHLRDAVDLGLSIVAGGGLVESSPPTSPRTFALPPLDASFAGVLDAMREPRPEDAPPWKRMPVKPVAFDAAHRLDADTVQLHLGHPLVRRLLARFRAQGFAAHDLSRVTLVENTRDNLRRVVLFGRLSLFGRGASRLHEEVVAISGQVQPGNVRPFAEHGEKRAIELLWDLLAESPPVYANALAEREVRGRAGRDFEALWPALEAQAADAEAHARAALAARGVAESQNLTVLLERQRGAIRVALGSQVQLALPMATAKKEEQDQLQRDRRAMEARLLAIDRELATEPGALAAAYDVVLRRFEPLGLAYLWPGT